MSERRDDVPPPDLDPALPRPRATRRTHLSLWLIWLIPLTAAAVGITLAVRALTGHGPTIVVTFRNGAGLEAGKTHIKLKEVDVGLVKAVRFTDDLQEVEVVAELRPGPAADMLMRMDTRFWVVKPRVGLGGVSGLDTLFSGAYIGVDPGRSIETSTTFRGLDAQPPITADVPGTEYTLVGEDLGSLDIGSPVYYRRVPVGQLSSFKLSPDGRSIRFNVFVAAPYDRFVTPQARFWQASGVDFQLDAQGVRVEAQSLASILAGGIAFQEGPASEETGAMMAQASRDTEFRLYDKREDAMRRPDGVGFDYRLLFSGSVRGLTVGAPVEYRGLPIGEVTRIAVEGNSATANHTPRIAVDIRVFPQRLPTVDGQALRDSLQQQRVRLDSMVAKGFRAQLRQANLLTGQLYVALEFFRDAQPARINWTASPAIMPTVNGGIEDLQETLASIARKIDALPLEALTGEARESLASLNTALKRADKLLARIDGEVAPSLQKTLDEARDTMGDLRRSLGSADDALAASRGTLADVQRAARSLRQLADTLEQHPEALLRGKPEDRR
jgi:paraquat-inducible protein B